MLTVTNLEAVDAVFAAKTPRAWRDVVLEIYPEATEDRNGRFHAPHDGYECGLTGRTFRAGEYLPMSEPDDNYRVVGAERKVPTAVDLNGVEYSWDGSRAQNLAVWSELFNQTREHEALLSKHVGIIGDKIKFAAKMKFVKGFVGYYGTVWVNVMKDDLGNVIVYKGTKPLAKKDEAVTIIAKVKAHGIRDGVRQTIIERPKAA
jgi:hypothetical protein